MKYILVSGGVISGLGKGITASSVGAILKGCGYNITSIKIDPYLNIDAGLMSPYEHGEVFVLNDGGEVDLDLGNYERFLNISLTKQHNITTGKIYKKVLDDERQGKYLGKTVQIIPHITNAIQEHIERVAKISVEEDKIPDICIIELGGTVGDIESMIFLEALRQFRFKIGEHNFFSIHVSLIPFANEHKTKPTQHSVMKLREHGIIPDMIVCRCGNPINTKIIQKISLFCMIPEKNVVSIHNTNNLYEVPQIIKDQNISKIILNKLKLKISDTDISKFISISQKLNNKSLKIVKIGIIGKYTQLKDSYLSLRKALIIAGYYNNVNVKLIWFDAEKLKNDEKLKNCDGILIPGGFGNRGIEGKFYAINYARKHKIPFFGICFGFQISIIEYARNICNIKNATSEEFNEKGEQIFQLNDYNTMHVGTRLCNIKPHTLAHKIYKNTKIKERYRHRYEFNNKYKNIIERHGLIISGLDNDSGRVVIIEYPDHPFFIACQFHPEYNSGISKPSPIFLEFIKSTHK